MAPSSMQQLRASATGVGLGLLVLTACSTMPGSEEGGLSNLPDGWEVGTKGLAFRDVTLIDGTGAPAREHFTVTVRGGSIVAVGPDSAISIPTGTPVVDARGHYLIPGLWDLHVHLAKAGAHVLPLFPANGVIGVRDMGGDAASVANMREAITRGDRIGPRIVMAGPMLESGEYMARSRQRRLVEPVERFRVGIGEPARARHVVDSVAATGADFIKLRTVDSISVYHEVANAARAAGLDLVGHAQNIPAEDVLAAGQRSVEHLLYPFLSARPADEAQRLARRFARAGTAFVPTLVTFDRSIFVPSDSLSAMLSDTAGLLYPRRTSVAGLLERDWNEQLEERIADEAAGDTLPWGILHRELQRDLRLLHGEGVAILPGTDLAVINIYPGSSLHDELELLVERVGLTPMQAIEAATRRAAALLHLEHETGTIEPGKAADLVLLSGNPLADITNTRRVAAVVSGGIYYDADALDILRGQAAIGAAAARSAIPEGVFELAAHVGGTNFPLRLELIGVEGRPWGRLHVEAGAPATVAVRGMVGAGKEWTFAVGGPVRTLRLSFDSVVTGVLVLGGGPPIPLEGRRTGSVARPDELLAHHVLEPLGVAARAGEEGASFPTLTPGGDLIFARHGPDLSRQTLMIAASDGDEWRDPTLLGIGNDHSDRSPAMLPDGSALVFASDRPLDGGGGDREAYGLWLTRPGADGGWGPPTPVVFEGGWPHDARQPSVAADGTLYFSSDAPGGRGAGDIYVATQLADGTWGTPRNLGAPINGPGDEHGVFIAPDGSRLILASAGDRPGRAGGDDLFVSEGGASGWSVPVPIKLPVNTFANEYGPWISALDGQLYFTSDRFGYARLFRIPFPTY